MPSVFTVVDFELVVAAGSMLIRIRYVCSYIWIDYYQP